MLGERDRADARGAGGYPDFLIIGAPRSGTTALADHLRAHPEAFVPERKELNFFQRQEPTPANCRRYAAHFAPAQGSEVAGEATPFYLASFEAHRRMRAVVPDARLVAILRDPAPRAYSHYWWRRLWGAEDRDFLTALRQEISDGAEGFPGYLELGNYRAHLDHLCTQYPREQILVLLFDDWVHDPSGTFCRLCEHLGVPAWVPGEVETGVNTTHRLRWPGLWWRMKRWRGRSGRRYALARRIDAWNAVPFRPPAMSGEAQDLLAEHFREPNAALERWLGRSLGDWC